MSIADIANLLTGLGTVIGGGASLLAALRTRAAAGAEPARRRGPSGGLRTRTGGAAVASAHELPRTPTGLCALGAVALAVTLMVITASRNGAPAGTPSLLLFSGTGVLFVLAGILGTSSWARTKAVEPENAIYPILAAAVAAAAWLAACLVISAAPALP
ncbi:hypothetical protein [Saccharopolyspora sp. CA-218241]|uniref:hypothetical protein n=1 Tax=Saccharopolyspora sp. CA-218241 TaxID=3240027 RepID=UPI003D95B654